MSDYTLKTMMNKPERLAPGHRMCAGCGATIAVRAVLLSCIRIRHGKTAIFITHLKMPELR